jgi:integrase
MGRRRKDGDPLGLAGTRLVFDHGRFYYIHRDKGRWENVGTDVTAAKQMAARYNNPGDGFGTVAYWLRMFLADCKQRVAAGMLSKRTLDDYEGYAADDGPMMAAFGRMFPERVTTNRIQLYLTENAKLGRPVPANRERAMLSSCLSWLIREGKVPDLKVNPCMRASGLKRNPESKRERYVTHDEYRAVYAAGNRAVRLAMELVYRSLQRPEVDVLAWTPSNVRAKDGGKVLHFKQSKTGRVLDIALVGELGALVAEAIGEVPQLRQPIVHRLDGKAYTYDGLSAMLKQAQDKVRAQHGKARGPLADMPSFGLRDLKGKGATDMWLAGVPIERIQLLCGHADKTTTERYIKARWRETAQPNAVLIG